MKNLLNKIKLTIVFLLLVIFGYGQNPCLIDDTASLNLPDDFTVMYASENGWILPSSGTLRVLFVFAEIDYDTGTDPNPNSTDGWTVHQLPNWAGDLFDPTTPSGQATGEVTRYFQEASSEKYFVLGDYLVKPNTGIFTVKMSHIEAINPNYTDAGHFMQALNNQINIDLNGIIITANSLNGVSYFDNWSKSNHFKPKATPSNDNPNKYDNVIFIWRNREGYNGTGNTAGASFNGTLLGYQTDTHINIGTFSNIPTKVIRHEYGHLILGGNDYHTAGGGWPAPSPNPYDYWIQLTGGWGTMGLSGSSLQCWSSWDRHRLNWKANSNVYNPSARDENNTLEVNGDLDATDLGDAGIYVLRDFITTGDAIRIKLPFTDPANEFNEYLWVENHNGISLNNSTFDKWQY